MARRFAVPVLLCALCLCRGQEQRQSEDEKVLQMAKEAQADMCSASSELMTPELRAERREMVVAAAGGEDLFYTALKNANDTEALGREIDASKIAGRGLPLVFSLLLLPIWLICCWTAWPCCRCCRMCAGKERKTPIWIRGGFCVLIGLVAVLMVIFGLAALQGHTQGMDGLYTTSCTSSELLEATLYGQNSSTPFIGFNPLLDDVAELRGSLNSDSEFIQEVTGLLSSTQGITDAVAIASGHMKLLRTVLSEEVNKAPYTSTPGDLYHNCELCDKLPEFLNPAVEALDGSLGKALAAAREQVDRQLQGPTRVSLQDQLDETIAPVNETKTTIRDSFKFTVDKDTYTTFVDVMKGPVRLLVLLITFLAFVLSLCGLLVATCWVCRDKSSEEREGVNPYYKSLHRMACCTWCSGFCVVFFALFIGGITVACVFFMSNLCVLMDTIDGAKLKEIMPSISPGTDINSPAFSTSLNVLDQCFLTQSQVPVNVMDLVNVTGENGTSLSFRSKFDGEVKKNIDDRFAEVASRMNAGNGSLASNTQFGRLLDILGNNPLDAMYIVDSQRLLADATYSALSGDADLSPLVPRVALACNDVNLTDDVPAPLGGATMLGIDRFDAAMATKGIAAPSVRTCGKPVVCSSPTDAACTAGNAYLGLKNTIRDGTFKCGAFVSPTDAMAECDPFTAANPFDCLFTAADGSRYLEEKVKDCTWSEWVQYVATFQQRIQADLQRIDNTSASVQTQITSGLQTSVSTHLLTPIHDMVSKVNCNFMADAYAGVIDGMCYQGVPGLRMIGYSYVACGVFGILLIIAVYAIWRRTIDNVNAWANGKLKAPSMHGV
eukprot:TRINITY_DN17902_c0_g1_i1.p1 TRINITY_DN17902_c0_g1~~TRINITY_DN17902_c0_g1_i1.p1  ORF type:complete len:835 (+),score=197.17 TRINITY_DN17902_c0_g1_i1:54-2558(+)